MGWINARTLPDSLSAYKQWFSGYGSWPGWIYGLPGTADPTHCGALPFREDAELSSVNSPHCLRGEDWAFIASVQAESTNLPDTSIYSGTRPAVLTVHFNLSKQDLSNAYTFLSGWSAMGAWGGEVSEISSRAWAIGQPDLGFPSYPGVGNAEYKITRESIINRLAITMANPSTTGDTLALSAMQDMFADYRQLRWTIQSIPPSYFGTGSASWDAVLYEGGISGGVDLPERNTSLLSAHSRDNPGLPSTQLVEADVNLYACVTVSQSVTDNRGNSNLSAWHYVFLPVRSGMVWANSQSDWDNYLHAFSTSGGALSGKDIAQDACDYLGVPLIQSPAPLDPGVQATPWSKTTITLRAAYLQIGQRWLVAYQ